jgi:hypothetical protein
LIEEYVERLRQQPSDLNVLILFQLEAKLGELFKFAEEKAIIREVDVNSGWKKALLEHQYLFQEIQEVLASRDDGDAAVEEDDQ